MLRQPLVSIIVITYNSSQYVIETLDSAIKQTYNNIEIIISDDCSSDKTIQVCSQWMKTCTSSKIKIELITTDRNTGTSGNCNRGLRVAKGEWIKVIAGDDVLLPTAIEDYVRFINNNPSARHLIANIVHFHGIFGSQSYTDTINKSSFFFDKETSVRQQYNIIRKKFYGCGPSYFIHSETLRSIGGYDERFPLQEDYPLYIKMIKSGYKMELLDCVTVYYRVDEKSVSHFIEDFAIFPQNMVRIICDYKYKYREESLGLFWKILHFYSLGLQLLIIKYGNSRKSARCIFLKALFSITDPFVWYSRCTKLLDKLYSIKKKN